MLQADHGKASMGLITGVLALLSIFPPVATDMYLSAMDDIALAFHASETATELSLSIFFLGLCVGQFIMGPLMDGFGRKPPLLAGAGLFILSSIGLLIVDDIATFNALRFIQAIGACSGMVVGRAVVNDLHSGREAARMMTILVMLMTLGPILSPFLGSLLLSSLGWESIFFTMVGIGIVAFVLAAVALPETLPPEKRSATTLPHIARAFASAGSQRAFLLPAIVAGLVQGGIFAFITGSSGIFQGIYGLGNVAYGLLFAFIAAALICFGRVNTRLLNRYEPRQIADAGLPVFALSALALTISASLGNMWLLVLPLWITVGLVGLITPNVVSIAMELGHAGSGIRSALLGGLQFAIAFTVSGSVALGGTDSALSMCLPILIASLLALALWKFAQAGGSDLPRECPSAG
ncbi:multidrug effflux MFS transporter [Amaricoccus macauensis]|uniref:multidrug effflux MFS transporter n=1 Tax=Amaricoccus macauensis TaxID=57001 RepID=UPI003C7B885E